MAENVTTLLGKWQKQQQDHPEWTPALEDILYVNHGSGSDRDRLYSLEQVRDLIQGLFELIHMEKNGSELDADGEKLIVTKSTQGGNYTAKLDKDGMIVGFPTIGYIRYGLRKIEFLAADGTTKVGEFSLDNGKFKFDKSVDVTGDIEGSGDVKAGGDLSATGSVVSSGKEVKSYGGSTPPNGSYFDLTDSKLVIASAPGQSGRNVFQVILNGSFYDMTGIGIAEAVKVVASEHAVGSEWKIGLNGGLAFKKVSGSSVSTVARFVDNELSMLDGSIGRVGKISISDSNVDKWSISIGYNSLMIQQVNGSRSTPVASFTSDGSLKLADGYFMGKNTVLATSAVDLTAAPYSNMIAGIELTIFNNNSGGQIKVTWGSGSSEYEMLNNNTGKRYVKGAAGWGKVLS